MTKKAALKTAGISMEGFHAKPKVIDGQSPSPAAGTEARRPFTGIGLNTMTANVSHELVETKRRLAEFDGATVSRPLHPKVIQRSQFANRIADEFLTSEFQQLRDEIASAGGNVQPIKVRSLATVIDDQSPKYEIVFGHRRHQACLELGLPVNALIVEHMSDQELFVTMDRENRGRKNLSAWEQGCMYRDALDKGLYPSERRLAEALGANQSDVNRAIKLARLPADVVRAFSSPLDLQVRWQKALTDAMQRDPDGVLGRAREVAKDRGTLGPAQVLEQLLGSSHVQHNGVDLVVAGTPVGSLRFGPKGRVVIDVEPAVLTESKRRGLAKAIERFLGSARGD